MNELALFGGKPVREDYLSYGRQWISDSDVDAVVKTLTGDFLTTGPVVSQFEKELAEYTGSKYAVAVANGTAALHMACFAAGIGAGDEVIVSPMTFAASANCVLYLGGTPVFADIDPITYNIDIKEIEKKITAKTKAIIPVDFTGQPVDMEKIRALADKYNLIIIEDGAHALGSQYKGQKVGKFADLTEYSFHPVKPITTGEGGIVTTNNEELYKRMVLFRTHGITRDRTLLDKNDGPWYYEQHVLGYNYRITDLQCALGISQLKRLDYFIQLRRGIANQYHEALAQVAEIVTPLEPDYSESGWHIYVIKLKRELLKASREEIFTALRAENIGVNVHYIPVHYHPYYKKLGYKKGICPHAEALYEDIITLPIFPMMDRKDVGDVIAGVKKVIAYYRK